MKRLLVLLAAGIALSGCYHIPQRAWYNGRNIRSDEIVYSRLTPTEVRATYAKEQFGYVATPPYAPFKNWKY
jgi:hypothetical protein